MRIRAEVSGVASFDALIAKSRAIGGTAQIAKEARATVPMVRLLYLQGYSFTKAPSGRPWAKRKREPGWPLLVKTPDSGMRDSTIVTAEQDGVRIVVPPEHADYQHSGTATIPARPVVPTSDLGRWEQPIGIARRNVGVDLE